MTEHLEIVELFDNVRHDVVCTEMWIRHSRIFMKYEFTSGPFQGKTIVESRAFQVPWSIEGGDE